MERDISDGLRKERVRQLKILIGNYEKALRNTKDSKTKENLSALIEKAKRDIKGIK